MSFWKNYAVPAIIGIMMVCAVSVFVVDLYYPVSNVRIETIVVGKNVFETGGGPAYWLSVKVSNSNSIFLTDVRVGPVIYYSIVIGAHISLDVRISPILHIANYKVRSYEAIEGYAQPVK